MNAMNNYNILIEKIEVFIRKYYLNKILRGGLFLSASLFLGYLLVTVAEYLGDFGSTGRTVLFFGYWLVNAIVCCWFVIPPLLAYLRLGRVLSHEDAAIIIGQHFGHVEDKLLNTLQLKRLAEEQPERRQLIEASIDQKIVSLRPVTFPSAVRMRENRKHIKWVAIPLVVIIILGIAAPTLLKESTNKIIQHDRYFAPRSPFQILVTNKALAAVQGEDFKLSVKLQGNSFPDDIYIQNGKNIFKLKKESTSRFTYLFSNIQQDQQFQLIGDHFISRTYGIKVRTKPSLLNFDVFLSYPTYLKKKNEWIYNAGDLNVPLGTSVTWQVHTRNATSLLFNMDGKIDRLTGKSNLFRKTSVLHRSGTYSLCTASDQVASGDSVRYTFNVTADQPPVITVKETQDSVGYKAIYFNGQAQDDHGFSSLIFHYVVRDNNSQRSKGIDVPVKADLGGSQTSFFYNWDLKDLHFTPGAVISYYFQVTDNNSVTGHQIARTDERTLHIPSESEVDQQMEADANAVKDKMQDAISLAAQIDKDIKKLNELLLNKPELSFDDKKQIQDLLNKRQELKKMLADAQQQNQQNAFNRQQNMPVNKELAARQDRMQELMKDLTDPKTDEMLKMLQNLMDNKQDKSTSKDLSKMQVDDKALSQQLNRTMELMKQLDVHTKVQESIDRLNKLADRQQQLAQDTKLNNVDPKALLGKQQQINKDFTDIKRSLDDASKKNDELENKANFQNPKADLQKIDEQLNKSAGNLTQNKKDDANTGQKEAAARMQQLAAKMQKNMQDEQLQDIVINGKNLKNLIRRLIAGSFDQENLISNLKKMRPDDPSYGAWTKRQRYVQTNMKTAQDSLMALSKRLPDIESTVISETVALDQHMNESIRLLEARRPSDAEKDQRAVMTSVNNLALMLTETLSKMQEALKQTKKSSGGSMGGGGHQRKTILELSEMQQQLNANMQAMRDQMRKQGQQLGKTAGSASASQGQNGPMSEQFAKLARQQAEIRQAIQQINNEENKDGHHALGDLGGLAKQMEKTEADLVNKRLSEEMLNRQLQIKTRMLEADKAEQERDEDSKRDSKAPQKDFPPAYVKALADFERQKSKQTEQLKTTPAELNDYYKLKVKAYFDKVSTP